MGGQSFFPGAPLWAGFGVFKVEVGATGCRNNPFAPPVSTEHSRDGDREGVERLGDKTVTNL